MNNIIENNKLIIAFMGMKPFNINGRYSLSKNHCTSSNDDSEDECINRFASITKYDTDYNWLMEVVYKISDIKSWSINATLEWMATEYETDGLYTIKDIFNVCIEFIKWYNQQQK